MIIDKTIEIGINNKNYKKYKELGYNIPEHKTTNNKTGFIKGSKIEINIKDIFNNSNVKIKVCCDECNKEYSIEYSKYRKQIEKNNGRLFCHNCSLQLESRKENLSKSLMGKYVGELNPNWNKNLTHEEREESRKTFENTEFVKKVLARDNYTCKCCEKESGGDVEVHHLDGWNWCKERRYDETNGITLCKTCHKNFHSTYGYGDNTKKQFEKWIGYAIELLKFEGELPTTRKIYCIEEDKIYDSISEFAKIYRIKNVANIYKVCNKTQKLDGSYNKSVKGKHLLWLDEYENMSSKEIEKYLKWGKNGNSKFISICNENMNIIFNGNQTECGEWLYNNGYFNSIQSGQTCVRRLKNKKDVYINKLKQEQLHFIEENA